MIVKSDNEHDSLQSNFYSGLKFLTIHYCITARDNFFAFSNSSFGTRTNRSIKTTKEIHEKTDRIRFSADLKNPNCRI